MSRLGKKVLGVVNYEPISFYVKSGFALRQLEEYYNPMDYFDTVHIFACGDTDWDISRKVHVHRLTNPGFKATLQLIRYCKQYGVNILRNFDCFGTHLVTLEVKRLLKIPAVLSLHDVVYPPEILGYDHIFTYVEWLKEAIITEYGCDKVTLLLNRIDENLFKPGTYDRVAKEFCKYTNRIVSIGRLDEDKNHSTLIKAMVNVVEQYPDTLLVIIGEGIERPKYEALIDHLRLRNHVRLVGHQPSEMVVEYLNWCDFHALCNIFGDLGRPFAEALMVGKPVVATAGKGNAKYHLTDGLNAKTVDYQDIFKPEAIASAILYMFENKNMFNAAAIRERAIAEYGYETLGRLEASIYDQVLTNHHRRSQFSPWVAGSEDWHNKTVSLRTIIKRFFLYSYCHVGSYFVNHR